jgi:hypothetical protein
MEPQSLALRPILVISIAIVARGTPSPRLFVQPAKCVGGLSASRHFPSCLARNVPRGTCADSSRSLNRRLCGSVSRPRLRPRIVSEIIEGESARVRKIRKMNDQDAGSLYLSSACADTLNSFSTQRANTAAMTAAPESAPATPSPFRAAPVPDRARRSTK